MTATRAPSMLTYDALTLSRPTLSELKALPLPQDCPRKECCLLIRHRHTTMLKKCTDVKK